MPPAASHRSAVCCSSGSEPERHPADHRIHVAFEPAKSETVPIDVFGANIDKGNRRPDRAEAGADQFPVQPAPVRRAALMPPWQTGLTPLEPVAVTVRRLVGISW